MYIFWLMIWSVYTNINIDINIITNVNINSNSYAYGYDYAYVNTNPNPNPNTSIYTTIYSCAYSDSDGYDDSLSPISSFLFGFPCAGSFFSRM